MKAVSSDFEHILDTSAVVTYLAGEKGADKVGTLISSSALPFLVFSELYYVVWGKKGKVKADEVFALVKSWNLPVLMPDERIILTAGRLKAVHRLGLADSYIAAFAVDMEKSLVTSDRDYQMLKEEIKTLYI
ncbi:MAG: PIN domain-containing protein [Candidatus Omnitrophica bacterium]|nr:PIN domain-containing protein [Candidatus Omnitrophota bacterium]